MKENQVHIPEGWKSKKLSSVCKIKKGIQFNKIELYDFGMYPCINGGIEPSGYSDLWNTNENTITISEGGNSCGYVNLVKTKFWSGGHCYSLLDLGNELDNDFLYQALKGRQHLIMDLRVGSGLPNIQQKAIKEFEFLIPNDKPEQTQIATILSKVDEAIAQTGQLIAKYTCIKTGLMQDLLTKGIDEHGNIRSEATHEFKDSPLGRIPKEWDVIRVEDIGDWKGGKTPRKSNKKYWEGAKNLWFSSKDIVSNLLTDSVYKISDSAISETNQTLFPAYRSLIFVFRSGILRHTFPVARSEKDFSINQDIKALVPNYKYRSEFLYYFFKSIEPIILSSFVKAGTTVESIDGKAFFDLPIGLPNEQEQLRIQHAFTKLDEKLKYSNQKLCKLQSLKTGLMQDLLNGKVRVNHLIKETANA